MKILLVDDNLGYLQLLGDLLRDHTYEVITAEDGKQARELLDEQTVDLIISDVYMPRLDGVWFHSYVREFSGVPEVPFIFVTGGVSNVEDLIVDRNRDFFVSKNAPIEELLSLVGSFDQARRLKTA